MVLLAVPPWLGCLERCFVDLGIVGSSPEDAERQFIFIFGGWPIVLFLLHMVCNVEKTTEGSFFNVADHVLKYKRSLGEFW